MAAKGTTFDNDLLKLIFNGTAITGLAVNDTGTPATTLYVALHTAAPATDQTSNEIVYTGYARVGVPRTSGGWTVTGNSVSPVNPIDFPPSSSGSPNAAFFSVGTTASGAGKMLYYGTITPNINVLSGGTSPRLTTASTITEN